MGLRATVFFLVKFRTVGFILKKYTTVATDMHFSFLYVITKSCLTHAHSVYAILTSVWCLEMKHDHRNWLTKAPPAEHTLACLIVATFHYDLLHL
jgi:hypothetical protein